MTETPIERAAAAIDLELDWSQQEFGMTPHALDIAQTVFESIDRDALAAFLDSPTHVDHAGGCLEDCHWPVHALSPADLAKKILAYLLKGDDK